VAQLQSCSNWRICHGYVLEISSQRRATLLSMSTVLPVRKYRWRRSAQRTPRRPFKLPATSFALVKSSDMQTNICWKGDCLNVLPTMIQSKVIQISQEKMKLRWGFGLQSGS
jgi:hypothetical protein